MSAVERSSVGGTGVYNNKGRAIGDHVAPLVRVGGMTAAQVHAWIVELYKRRNDALHEGLWMLDDLDATRLVDVALSVIRWVSFHLDEDHDHLEPCRAADRVRKRSAAFHPWAQAVMRRPVGADSARERRCRSVDLHPLRCQRSSLATGWCLGTSCPMSFGLRPAIRVVFTRHGSVNSGDPIVSMFTSFAEALFR